MMIVHIYIGAITLYGQKGNSTYEQKRLKKKGLKELSHRSEISYPNISKRLHAAFAFLLE